MLRKKSSSSWFLTGSNTNDTNYLILNNNNKYNNNSNNNRKVIYSVLTNPVLFRYIVSKHRELDRVLYATKIPKYSWKRLYKHFSKLEDFIHFKIYNLLAYKIERNDYFHCDNLSAAIFTSKCKDVDLFHKVYHLKQKYFIIDDLLFGAVSNGSLEIFRTLKKQTEPIILPCHCKYVSEKNIMEYAIDRGQFEIFLYLYDESFIDENGNPLTCSYSLSKIADLVLSHPDSNKYVPMFLDYGDPAITKAFESYHPKIHYPSLCTFGSIDAIKRLYKGFKPYGKDKKMHISLFNRLVFDNIDIEELYSTLYILEGSNNKNDPIHQQQNLESLRNDIISDYISGNGINKNNPNQIVVSLIWVFSKIRDRIYPSLVNDTAISEYLLRSAMILDDLVSIPYIVRHFVRTKITFHVAKAASTLDQVRFILQFKDKIDVKAWFKSASAHPDGKLFMLIHSHFPEYNFTSKDFSFSTYIFHLTLEYIQLFIKNCDIPPIFITTDIDSIGYLLDRYAYQHVIITENLKYALYLDFHDIFKYLYEKAPQLIKLSEKYTATILTKARFETLQYLKSKGFSLNTKTIGLIGDYQLYKEIKHYRFNVLTYAIRAGNWELVRLMKAKDRNRTWIQAVNSTKNLDNFKEYYNICNGDMILANRDMYFIFLKSSIEIIDFIFEQLNEKERKHILRTNFKKIIIYRHRIPLANHLVDKGAIINTSSKYVNTQEYSQSFVVNKFIGNYYLQKLNNF